MTHFVIVWLATAVSLLIISRLPLGVEIDKFSTALIAALALGILNAFLRPVLAFLAFPLTLITFGLFAFVLNAIIFGLAAWFVEGFHLRGGFWSALIGSIVLTLLNSLISRVLF
ncbi:MAG: phage holin family protein [Candidatus Tectomicrobia bacterium]|nr:phage holin family protein [Candidatus Tectomicrobia bacterium]